LSGSPLKGFYDCSDARLAPEPSRDRVVSSVFYGMPAELVAEWCGVSVETARRWKAGKAEPGRPALRLVELHRSRKVLTSPAWDGWLVNGEALAGPDGKELTQGQLRAYELIYQLCHELGRERPDFAERLAMIHQLAAG
jgi:hypothetical protein